MAKDTLTVTDNRTGRSCEIPIEHGAIRAAGLRPLGLVSYDPAFANTAACTSRITYIDGDAGVLLYRGYPIEQLAEQSTFLETAYLLIKGELPNAEHLALHDVQGDRAQVSARPGPRARARRALHPARRPRAELLDQRHALDRQLAGRPVLRARRRLRGALRAPPRRGERGRAAHAGGDRLGRKHPRVLEAREGGRGAAHGLRPPGLPQLRSAREGDQAPRRAGVRGHGPQPPPGRRPRARAHRARGRLLRLAQALSQRRLLLGHHLPGDGLPGGHVPGPVRHRAHRGLDRAVARDGAGPGAEDRPPAAALPGPRAARLRAARGARGGRGVSGGITC